MGETISRSLVLSVVLVLGCGGDSPSGAAVSRLRSCGLLSGGRVNLPPAEDEYARCRSSCIAEASCEDLEPVACRRTAAESLTDCFERCEEEGFACEDGTEIFAGQVCDREVDCEGAEDELDCEFFVCDDEEEIPAYWQCDGEMDCELGEDERDCPTFRCADGERIPAEWECDLEEDCELGEDERDCAQWVCE